MRSPSKPKLDLFNLTPGGIERARAVLKAFFDLLSNSEGDDPVAFATQFRDFVKHAAALYDIDLQPLAQPFPAEVAATAPSHPRTRGNPVTVSTAAPDDVTAASGHTDATSTATKASRSSKPKLKGTATLKIKGNATFKGKRKARNKGKSASTAQASKKKRAAI